MVGEVALPCDHPFVVHAARWGCSMSQRHRVTGNRVTHESSQVTCADCRANQVATALAEEVLLDLVKKGVL